MKRTTTTRRPTAAQAVAAQRQALYTEAVEWLASNDDTTWAVHNPDNAFGSPNVTAHLVADLFRFPVSRVRYDVRKVLARHAEVRAKRAAKVAA